MSSIIRSRRIGSSCPESRQASWRRGIESVAGLHPENAFQGQTVEPRTKVLRVAGFVVGEWKTLSPPNLPVLLRGTQASEGGGRQQQRGVRPFSVTSSFAARHRGEVRGRGK